MQSSWNGKRIAIVVIGIVVVLCLCIVAILGVGAITKSYQRYQKRADANNQTQINAIRIRQTEQLVQVAQQEAAIRVQKAYGIRDAQEEIATTLTPLFVQYEMIDALEHIAASGENNTVVYIPAGATGVPLVSVTNEPQVFQGEGEE